MTELTDTKPCGCGKVMIRRFNGIARASNGPTILCTEFRCYGCGQRDHAPDHVTPAPPDPDRLRWEKANEKPKHTPTRLFVAPGNRLGREATFELFAAERGKTVRHSGLGGFLYLLDGDDTEYVLVLVDVGHQDFRYAVFTREDYTKGY